MGLANIRERLALQFDSGVGLELLAAQPFLGRLERVFAAARPRPVTPQYVRVSQVLQSGFSAAISGLKTPQAALAHAQERLEAILDAA